MIGRNLPSIALVLFFGGVVLGFAGIRDEGDSLTRAGILIGLSAIPPFIIWQTQRAHQNAADELANAHTAGYRLALAHVAAGLLDQPTAPPDGGQYAEHADSYRADLADDDTTAEPAGGAGRLFVLYGGHSSDHYQPDTDDKRKTGT